MAPNTIFLVVPFHADARGVLRAGAPRRSASRTSALSMAEALAPFHAGVMVLLDRSDPAAGAFHEPLLIGTVGDVPGDLLRRLAA